LKRDVSRLTELWTQGLDSFGGPFLAGPQFTAADAFFAPVAFRVRTYGLDVGQAGKEWVNHMLGLAPMLAWEKDALTESWREAGHEAELRDCGVITADYRQG
jgi:glutathione S-transferase